VPTVFVVDDNPLSLAWFPQPPQLPMRDDHVEVRAKYSELFLR